MKSTIGSPSARVWRRIEGKRESNRQSLRPWVALWLISTLMLPPTQLYAGGVGGDGSGGGGTPPNPPSSPCPCNPESPPPCASCPCSQS